MWWSTKLSPMLDLLVQFIVLNGDNVAKLNTMYDLHKSIGFLGIHYTALWESVQKHNK